ncbi:MAG: hypothetical protein K2M87_03970, partial [Muribaculaceae bacterium]|nr:hypothetical protein [Muribaculaceae bacterium]
VYKPFVGRGGNVIPFGDKVSRLDNPRSKTEMLLQDCEDNAYKSGNLEKATFFAMQVLNMQPESTRERYLDQCLARYADSKWGAQFIVQKNDFRQMESFLQKYPDAPAIRDVKLAIANLLQQHIEVTVPGQVLPGQEFAAQVKSANISDLYLLVVSLPTANPEKDFKYSDLSKSGKLVQVAPVNFNMQKPASSDTTVNLKGLASGLYAVVPSSTREIAGVINSGSKQSVSVMQVSSLAAQIVTAGKERTLYIVKGTDSKPIVGARVSVWPIVKGARGAAKKLVTNAEGTVKLSDTQAFFLAKEGSDMVWGRVYNAYENQKDIKKNYRASLFADRSIYRPGSKAGLALVLWSEQENVLASAADETVRVVLNDAKYQPVDTLELTTDKFGRCNADITIPQDKPLGTWHIEAVCRGNYAGSTSFEVADYKAPTFSVSLVSSSENWTPGSTLVFRGE